MDDQSDPSHQTDGTRSSWRRRGQQLPMPLDGNILDHSSPQTRRSNRTKLIPKKPSIGDHQSSSTADDMQSANSDMDAEVISEDDICAICQQLLYRPVTTKCNHTLCESCMATWADVSVETTQMDIVEVEAPSEPFDAVSGLEARCPMCRTQTAASLNNGMASELQSKYPKAYVERAAEGSAPMVNGEIQTITLNIGNRHKRVKPTEGSQNSHDWTFFVRPSRTDIIEEVHIHLHPTFRRSKIIRTRPPYEIARLGWGYFTIMAHVILKAGYSWVSEDAEDTPDGAEKGLLCLKWTLDFHRHNGRGSMGRLKLKVRNQRGWDRVEDEEEQDDRAWNQTVRQYHMDGTYAPEDDS